MFVQKIRGSSGVEWKLYDEESKTSTESAYKSRKYGLQKRTQFKERVRNLLEVSLDQVLIYLPALGTSVIIFNRRLNEKNGKNSNN